VVTEAEAASAIGQAVTPGVLGNATVEGGRACVFYGASAPSPHNPNVAQPDSVRVVVVKGSDALTWFKDYKSKVRLRRPGLLRRVRLAQRTQGRLLPADRSQSPRRSAFAVGREEARCGHPAAAVGGSGPTRTAVRLLSRSRAGFAGPAQRSRHGRRGG
jgi:hypothetical protein